MLSEAELQRRWENLTFTDDFIFSRVMHDREICRQVVELILGVKIGEIQYLSAQDELKADPDSMRVIMDVFLRDEKRIINVEMQTGHRGELPRRSRYYQSVADVRTIPTGAKYRSLPDNIVIFICTFDPFRLGLPRYTFEYTCRETSHQLKLEDGTLRIFLNISAKGLCDLDASLQAFYHYIQQGTVESELTKSICDAITTLKNDSIARRQYMTLALKMADIRYDAYEEGFEQGREDGFRAGREEGREEGIAQGTHQKALETARRLIVRGDPPGDVADVTGLPVSQVEALMAEEG